MLAILCTAYHCRERFQGKEFKSAFRAKSYVSMLNSAYFVYNVPNPSEIKIFQEKRFEVLRQVTAYMGIEAAAS